MSITKNDIKNIDIDFNKYYIHVIKQLRYTVNFCL